MANKTIIDIVEQLKTRRENKNLSQQEVGERMGYTGALAQVAIARWETAARVPNAVNLEAWAEALDAELTLKNFKF